MATAPVTPSPDPTQAGASPSPAQQQANPLQTALAQLAQVCDQLAQQNPIVQPELEQAKGAFIQALQKTMMASQPQPAAAPAPQQG